MAKRILIHKESGRILQFQDTDLFNYSDPHPEHEVIEISEDDWNTLVKVEEIDDEVHGMKVKRYVIRPKVGSLKEEGIFLDKETFALWKPRFQGGGMVRDIVAKLRSKAIIGKGEKFAN